MKVRKTLGIGAGVLLGLVLLLVVAALIFVRPERLKETALARARAATGYAIEAGPASIHFGLSGVGIRVRDLEMAAPDSSQLLRVPEVDVYAKLLPLLKRRVELRKVALNRPRYFLREAEPGAPAAGAPSPRGGTGTASPAFAFLAVESWTVSQGAFRRTAPGDTLTVAGIDLDGGFSWNAREGARGSAQGEASEGRLEGPLGSYALPPVRTQARFRLSARGDSLFLPTISLQSGDLRASLSGGYHLVGGEWVGALEGSVEPVTWDALRKTLPAGDLGALDGIELAGTFASPGFRIARDAAGKSLASGRVTFTEVSVKAPTAPLGLSGFQGTIDFAPEAVALEKAKGRLGSNPVALSARVSGAAPRRLEASLATRFDGATLGGLLPVGTPVTLDRGSVTVDLAVSGALPLDRTHLPAVNGTVTLDDLGGAYRELPLRALRGTVRFGGDGAALEGIGASVGASDFVLNGTVPHLEELRTRFTLVSKRIDLNQLLPENRSAAPDTGRGAPMVALPGTGTVQIGSLIYRKTTVNDVNAGLTLSRDGLEVPDLHGSVYGGTVNGNLSLTPAGGGETWVYRGDLRLAGIGIAPALADWTPVGPRVEGTTDARIVLDGRAGPRVDVVRNLDLTGDLRIADGAVVNVPALERVASFLDIKGASGDRWPFRTLTLGFAVRQGRVQVDTLRVLQSGLGWILSGSVGLEGDLALSGTLRADPSRIELPAELKLLAPYVAEADGRIPVDFKLTGRLSSPGVEVDWSALAARAAEKAKREEGDRLQKELEKTVTDPATLDKLKKLLGGGKKKTGSGN